jgi:ferredoxin
LVRRKIVKIDQSLCNGCGACIPKCAEGALQIINGKATVVKDTYCDGLGACLGQCPQGAITIIEREAPEFDEKEVHEYLKTRASERSKTEAKNMFSKPQWPIKLNLIPVKAPFFDNADLLIAADCAPIALKDFDEKMLQGKKIAIGCPKFDDARAYAQKLGEILKENNISSITVAHMEVPCCSALNWVVSKALEASGKKIPVKEYEISVGGEVNER